VPSNLLRGFFANARRFAAHSAILGWRTSDPVATFVKDFGISAIASISRVMVPCGAYARVEKRSGAPRFHGTDGIGTEVVSGNLPLDLASERV
jgi:hypothetical protein